MINVNSQKNIDPIAQEFANKVRRELGDHVKKIILFGSRARGDFQEGSDYDFLVILDEKTKKRKKSVLQVSTDIMNNYFEMAGYIVWDENEWEVKKHSPLGLNVQKEGVEF